MCIRKQTDSPLPAPFPIVTHSGRKKKDTLFSHTMQEIPGTNQKDSLKC